MRMRLDPALAGLIRTLRTRAGGPVVILDAETVPWASATFEGGRHRIGLRLADAATAQRVAQGLRVVEFDLDMTGHIVADVSDMATDGDTLTLTALTVRA